MINDQLTYAAYIKVKVKGLKDSKFIGFNRLQKLLIKNNELSISNVKWYRNFSESNINIKEELYTLIVTANKRIPIYEKNVFVDTKHYTLKNSVIIDDEL
jgi:predicted membrane-bound dolichyl-phosphate-mannose-protein mannosyltransferase